MKCQVLQYQVSGEKMEEGKMKEGIFE